MLDQTHGISMLSADDTKNYPKYEKLWNEIFQLR